MFRLQILRLHKGRAVSTIIGGLIMLTLILSALGTTVLVSEHYAQYEQINNQMTQFRDQQLSEKLVINSPGLTLLSSAGNWGSGCVTTYNCYNITVSNLGGVGVQLVRIYINSTGLAGTGCNPQLCILNPTFTIAPYAFDQQNQFLNPGEVNHAIVIALPVATLLPSPTPAFPENTVMLVTARGNVFSFQWPFQLQFYYQSQSAFSSGIMKVAYQCTNTSCGSSGYDSKNEPGVTGGKPAGQYCHTEPLVGYPAPSYDAEQLTGINGVGVGDSGVLTFVNPWVTETIFASSETTPTDTNATQIYMYVNVINTGSLRYSPAAGSIDLTWYSADHIDGLLIGVYYQGKFSSSSSTPVSIAPGTNYYAIFHINIVKLQNWPPPITGSNGQTTPSLPIMWWGAASLTDNYENGNYYSGSILLSGLWIRSSC